jgi:hypothetical protein
MFRQLARRVRPRLEVLEDRCTPSTLTNFLDASGLTELLPDGKDGTVKFKASQPDVPTEIVPFEVVGSGTAPQGLPLFPGGMAPHNSAGLSNLHGGYSGNGSFTLLSFTSPTTGTFDGTFDFVADDGDQLACNYGAGAPGTFTITPVGNGKVIAQFLAVFTPIPSECTGRFADVIGGGFTMVAVTQPFDPTPNAQGYTMPFQYSWEGEGMLVERTGSHHARNVPFIPLPLTFAAPSVVAPFETAGAGHAPQGVPLFPGGMIPHDATGGINLLDTFHGKYSGNTGEYTFLGFTSPSTGDFTGQYTFIASNGDQLACTYGAGSPGTFTIYPVDNGKVVVQFVAVFAPITSECTGRFANITGGSFMMIATTDPFNPTPNAQGFTEPFTYSWVGAGLFLEQPPQNPPDDEQIIGLLELGELAAAIATLGDFGESPLHSSPELSSVHAGTDTPDRFPASPAQPAVMGPPFTTFGLSNRTAFPPAAGGGNLLDTDTLSSALNGDLFVTIH